MDISLSKNYLQLLDSLDFNEIQIRWGFYEPPYWSNWNETRDQAADDSKFLEDSNTIFSTIRAIRTLKNEKNLKIKVMWDLGGELPKDSLPTRKYMKRLWAGYLDNGFSLDDTYGFSLAYGELMFRQYIDDLRSTGKPLPNFYSFDIYPNPSSEISIYSAMTVIKEVLAENGQLGKGIILQESYYNNASVATDLLRARNELGLNILGNMDNLFVLYMT